MKTFIVLSIFFTINSFHFASFAQGESAVPFLLLQPSPSLSAMGQTGTALPTDDPFGFIWNPAQLGYTSQYNNFSFVFYPSKLEWLPLFDLDLEVKGLAFNFGYNFKDLINFPLSLGFGYTNFEINFGEYLRAGTPDPEPLGKLFESKDYYNSFSMGVGIDYFVNFCVGINYKSITSSLSDYPYQVEQVGGTADVSAIDFGILVNLPVKKLINRKLQIELENKMHLIPNIDFSIGYSKSNIGDEVYYVDPDQADPLPRMDRLGYAVSLGLDLLTDDFRINALNLSFTAEADDILIKRETIGSNDWEYQPTLSDLNIWENVINIEGDENIVSHAGLKIDLFETISFYMGHFDGRGFNERKTDGIEIRAKALFKVYALWAKHPFTDFISDHIDIRFYNANYFADSKLETNMTGLAFYIHNLDTLF